MGRAYIEAAREAGLVPDDATTGGPSARMAKVAARSESMEKIQLFEATAGGTHVMRSCEMSSESVASGIR